MEMSRYELEMKRRLFRTKLHTYNIRNQRSSPAHAFPYREGRVKLTTTAIGANLETRTFPAAKSRVVRDDGLFPVKQTQWLPL
jgi:hypothetical protein